MAQPIDFTHVHKVVNRNYRKQLSHKSPDTRTQRLSVIHGISNLVVNGIWFSQIQPSIIFLCAPSLNVMHVYCTDHISYIEILLSINYSSLFYMGQVIYYLWVK